MQLMVVDTFTTRLHAACSAAGIPVRGRAPELLRRMKSRGNTLTVQGVRKWLDGEAIPKSEHLAELAVILNIQTDTLLTGRVPALPANVPRLSDAGPLTPLQRELLAAAGDLSERGLYVLIHQARQLAADYPAQTKQARSSG